MENTTYVDIPMDVQLILKDLLRIFPDKSQNLIRLSYTDGSPDYTEKIRNLRWKLIPGVKVINLLESDLKENGLSTYAELTESIEEEDPNVFQKRLAWLYKRIPEELCVSGKNFNDGVRNIFQKSIQTLPICAKTHGTADDARLQLVAGRLGMEMPTLVIRDRFPDSEHNTSYECYIWKEIKGHRGFATMRDWHHRIFPKI